MAKKPTHYKLTVKRPVDAANAAFRPGARYTVKAAVRDAIKDKAPDAIATEFPIVRE